MTEFYTNHKKPQADKSFFHNYKDHCVFLKDKFKDIKIVNTQNIIDEDFIIDRLKMLESLRDAHDYMDEIVGATATPLLAAIGTICLWTNAIVELILALGSVVKLVDSSENHLDLALNSLTLGASVLVVGIFIAIKSLASLVTRPIVTAIDGFKPQDEDRFENHDSVESGESQALSS